MQCDFLCPQPATVTSTPTKGARQFTEAYSPDGDFDDDVNATVDTAAGSIEYLDSSNDTDNCLPADKQPTYLVYESALMLLFVTCFICTSKFVTIKKLIVESLIVTH